MTVKALSNSTTCGISFSPSKSDKLSDLTLEALVGDTGVGKAHLPKVPGADFNVIGRNVEIVAAPIVSSPTGAKVAKRVQVAATVLGSPSRGVHWPRGLPINYPVSMSAEPRNTPEYPLSPRERRFVAAYLLTWNGAEAARQAGYSAARAATTGAELRRRPAVAAAIEAGVAGAELSAAEALERLARIARLPVEGASAGEVIRSLELTLKHHGELDERVRITVNSQAAEAVGKLEAEFADEPGMLRRIAKALQ